MFVHQWLIMLESIALCIIGAAVHLVIETERKKRDPRAHLVTAVALGIILFAILGEPTAETAPLFIFVGYFGPSFFKNMAGQYQKRIVKPRRRRV